MHWSSVAAVALGTVAPVLALDAVEVVGNKFFNKDGSQFFIKGVAYQLSDQDPLLDTAQCKRDASLMQELGANAIRVYHVDPKGNHDGCMSAFEDAGIYTLIDLETFDTYILPTDLYWNQTQYERYSQVMDKFQGYDNVLAFFIGNENIAKETDSIAAPFLKAAARDMKAYRDNKGYRQIPIGYSAADIKELRPMLQDYLTCGGNSSDSIDFFGLNSYSWCGDSNYLLSTYDEIETQAKNFPVPIFLTETGCIVPPNRLWQDQDAIFTQPMVNDWSGAIAYEWIQEANEYGIVTYDGPKGVDGIARGGNPQPKQPDFNNLKAKWAANKPTGVKKANYNADSVSTRACPSATPGGWWNVAGNVQLPVLNQKYTGGYTTQASATSDPSQTQSSKASGTASSEKSSTTSSGSGSSGSSSSGSSKAGNSAASLDKSITIVGATFASVVLGIALML